MKTEDNLIPEEEFLRRNKVFITVLFFSCDVLVFQSFYMNLFLDRVPWRLKFRSPTCRTRLNGSWTAKFWISLSLSQTRYFVVHTWRCLYMESCHSSKCAIPTSPQVSVIKVKIHEATGMPAGKQKLQYEVRISLELCFTLTVIRSHLSNALCFSLP